MSGAPWGPRRWAGAAFVAAAFVFLGIYVARNVDALRAQEWNVSPSLLLGSLVLNVAGLFWGVGAWRVLLRSLGHEVRLPVLARIWFLSALGRYIPGKIWQFVGAAQIGRASGIPSVLTVTSLAAHTLFFLIGACLVSVYLMPLGSWIDPGVAEVARWAAPLLLLVVHPRIVGGAFRLIGRIGRRENAEWRGKWSTGLLIVLLACINWVIAGAALHLFIASLVPLPLSALPRIIGINAATFIIGNVIFIAPAGLGAKEWSLALLLAFYMAAPVAAVVAVAVRLWTVAAEVVPALLLLRHGPTLSSGRTVPVDSSSAPADP